MNVGPVEFRFHRLTERPIVLRNPVPFAVFYRILDGDLFEGQVRVPVIRDQSHGRGIFGIGDEVFPDESLFVDRIGIIALVSDRFLVVVQRTLDVVLAVVD